MFRLIFFIIIIIAFLYASIKHDPEMYERLRFLYLTKNGWLAQIMLILFMFPAALLALLLSNKIASMPDFNLISFIILTYLAIKLSVFSLFNVIDSETTQKERISYYFKEVEIFGYTLGSWGIAYQYLANSSPNISHFSFDSMFLNGIEFFVYYVFIRIIGVMIKCFFDKSEKSTSK